ncbi:MAG: CoB--CoM heterodisulfide reductase iron-sulfur subunit A family protein, partial [Dehalococcoidales bacterium]|nr:CoB--CoM heterodisulfide reductase iron-sulfur subunit A family protein [Dehalococcoidales bacterium]
ENPKAIRCNSQVALKKSWVIDINRCTKCGLCAEKCPAHAIDLEMQDEIRDFNVGNIIVSTGFEEYNAADASAFGYQRYPNVLTNLELEQLLSKVFSQEQLCRPSDGKVPQSVAFLQCIGSRNQDRDYCSAVCCMYALKEAIMLKQAKPEIDITIYFMDMRAYGKSYHRYYEQARDKYGIKFERCRVPVVNQDFRSKDLLITHAGSDNKIITSRFDMVVLSVGQNPSSYFTDICKSLGIKTGKWGFCETQDFNPVATDQPGIYVCGTATGPKDIVDTVTESTAAAGQILASGSIATKPIINNPQTPSDAVNLEPKTAVFLCNCHHQLSQIINTESIKEYAKSLPGVVKVFEVDALCQPEARQQVLEYLKENNENSVIMVGCSRIIPWEFSDYPVDIIDIRETVAWVHRSENEAATNKIKQLIGMSLEKIRARNITNVPVVSVTRRALIIGGGLAGMTAACLVAGAGIEVDIIEKSGKLGGNSGKIHHLLDRKEFPSYINQLTEKIKSEPLIHLRLNTEVLQLEGYAGNFKCTLQEKGGESSENEYGAVIVASGAEGLRPDEYLYGKSEKVITQAELEDGLASKAILPENIKSIAMIQCVGSRDSTRPYCSRICCVKALKNALYMKQENPQIEITMFYRDLMSYGLKEEYYTRAREKGILFIRFEPEKKPVVTFENNELKLITTEPELGKEITLKPDWVVLSPAIVPCNTDLAAVLDTELSPDGFFNEAEPKFRSVDIVRDGVYICGLAHSPRDISETIVQAQAAAERVISLLAKGELVSSRYVSTVNERRCSGCERCVQVCPYQARIIDTEKKVAVVLPAICRGCGACVAACPNGAAGITDSGAKQIFSMIDYAV